MKYQITALALAAVCTAVSAGAARFQHTTAFGTSAKSESRIVRAPMKEDAKPIWCPQTEATSVWEGDWVPYELYSTSYTTTGKIALQTVTEQETGASTRLTYAYDANDMEISKITQTAEEGEEFADYEKDLTAYDSRVTDFITSRQTWFDFGSGWVQNGNNYTQTLTRDAAGNVILVERAVLFNGIFDPTMRLHIEYTDGKASRIVQEDLTYDYATSSYSWEESAVISDIVWVETDGQIVSTESIVSIDGPNRAASYKLVDEMNQADVTVAYTADSYTITRVGVIQGHDNTTNTFTYQITDANGSERLVESFSVDEEDGPYVETYTDEACYDAYGYTTMMKSTVEYEGITDVLSHMEGELTYDDTYGYPLTYIISELVYDEPEGEDEEEPGATMTQTMKSEMSDYVNAALSSVSDIAVENSDSAVRYFNLHGQPVSAGNLTPGLYIVRKGNKVSKEYIR